MNAIVAKDLKVHIEGRSILDGIDLELHASKVTGLLGPSGAGKTTLMRAIVGLQRVSSGELTVLGHSAGSRQLRSEIGYMTQAPAVYPDITVSDNLDYFGTIMSAPRDQAAELLESLHLTELKDQLVGTLSGGERARVSLAVALLGSPKLLVLDEPTVGLDPILRRDIWDSLHALAKSGVTVLVSSHVMDEAERCDQLILVRDGKILANDTPKAIASASPDGSIESAFISLVESSK